MVNLKFVLVVMLITVSLMVGCVSGIVFDKNAPEGETKIVSGIVSDIRFTSSIYSYNSATYMIVFEGGHWFIAGGRTAYGVDVIAQQNNVSQIEFYHNYHLHFVKKYFGWELIQVEEVKSLG